MRVREAAICKFETDSTAIGQVFCCSIIDVASGVLTAYPDPVAVYKAAGRLLAAEIVISHSKFHGKVLERIFGTPPHDYFDTMDAVKTLFPYEKHRLQDWAARYKMDYPPGSANERWTPALQRRCDAGARVIERLYRDLSGMAVVL